MTIGRRRRSAPGHARVPRVLIEPNAHHLLNVGDVAMLEDAFRRVRAQWPGGSIEVVTADPVLLARHCPGAVAVPAAGRAEFFRSRYVGVFLHRRLRPRLSRSLSRAEDALRWRHPRLAAGVIAARLRLVGRDPADVRRFVASLRSTDVLVVGGAGMFTDAFAPLARSVLDMIALVTRRGGRAVLLGQGMGPLADPSTLRRAAEVLPTAELIGLREGAYGPSLLRLLGVPADRVATAGDAAVEAAWAARGATAGGSGIGLALRAARYAGLDGDARRRIGAAVQSAAARRAAEVVPVAISRVPHELDAHVLDAALGTPAGTTPLLRSPEAAIGAVGRCRLVVSGSYHAALFALAQGIPAVGLISSPYYEQKFLGLRHQFDGYLDVVAVDDADLSARLDAAIARAWDEADAWRPHLLDAAARQVTASGRLADRLVALTDPAARAGSAPGIAARSSDGAGGPARRRRARRDRRPLPFNLASQAAATWDERGRAAARLVDAHVEQIPLGEGMPLRVADLGCGNQRLRRILADTLSVPIRYQGYDLLPQAPDVVGLDLERALPNRHHDMAFCLGVLEYLEDLGAVLRRLAEQFPVLVVSYSVSDAEPALSLEQRRQRGWRSHLSRTAFASLLTGAGCELSGSRPFSGGRGQVWLARGRSWDDGSSAAARHSPPLVSNETLERP